MKYLVVGAGGTGGCIAGFLAHAGKDVDLIARGEHLRVIREQGLTVRTSHRGDVNGKIAAFSAEEYDGRPDAVFVCVKTYSLESVLPLLRRVCGAGTVVIPIQNAYGMGGRLAAALPESTALDGCVYIMAEKEEPGYVRQNGKIYRIFFGMRDGAAPHPSLGEIQRDLEESGARAVLSENIARDVLMKLSHVSPLSAVEACGRCTAGEVAADLEKTAFYTRMVREVEALAAAVGAPFAVDAAENNLKILRATKPDGMTSLHRDLIAGGANELDTMIFSLLEKGRSLGLSMPAYEKAAACLRELYQTK